MFSRNAVLGLVLALGVVPMAACNSNGDEPKDQSALTQRVIESQVPSGDNGDLVEPKGARADLKEFRCTPKGKRRWAATGAITNNGKQDARYLVRVSVVVADTSEVVASRESTLAVAVDASKGFAIRGIKGRNRGGVECAVRVVRSEVDD